MSIQQEPHSANIEDFLIVLFGDTFSDNQTFYLEMVKQFSPGQFLLLQRLSEVGHLEMWILVLPHSLNDTD